MLRKEIFTKNASGDNQQLSEQELSDLIVSAVGVMSVEDKPTLVSLLQKSGSLVTDLNTQGEILDATFKSIRDSQQFRNDLFDYLVEQGSLNNVGEEASMDGGYFNAGGKIGAFIKDTIGTKENISALFSVGIGYLGASLQSKANKGAGQQAIDYTNAQANLEALKLKQLQALQSGSGSGGGATPPPPSSKPKWVKPVLIGVGVLVLGLTIYFVAKKKK